jgi:SAM-dependent methyltransferase
MRTCPVCTAEFPNFLPIPESYVRFQHDLHVSYSLEDFETMNVGQYLCPHCDASDRDRLYALFVRDHLKRRGGDSLRVLDIAPGRALSRYLRALPGVDYLSGDLDPALADRQVDITDLRPFEDGAFELIVCSHVLEHVPEDRRAMRELLRVLAPGGRAVLMVPILSTATRTDEDPGVSDVTQRWLRFGQGDHVRMYCRQDFIARLRESGWSVAEMSTDSFAPGSFRQHGITERSVLYVGSKQAA